MHDQAKNQVEKSRASSIAGIEAGFTDLIDDPSSFSAYAAAVIDFQKERNRIYRRFAAAYPETPVPFLPVAAFKYGDVVSFDSRDSELLFHSSGTGLGLEAHHFVRSAEVYRRSIRVGFEWALGASPFVIVGHLPGYRESGERSSLLFMVEDLIASRGAPGSHMFVEDIETLRDAIKASVQQRIPLLLFGAAFGLVDLLESAEIRLPAGAKVIETGGMKTRRREIERRELHDMLSDGFGVPRQSVLSEYGMCELLSQCYTRGSVTFYPPPWVRFEVVDEDDPSVRLKEGEPGVLALIDLANMYSASAILTEDIAVRRGDGFEVLGRLEGSGLRGCNFLLDVD